jgi:hypothetical protein
MFLGFDLVSRVVAARAFSQSTVVVIEEKISVFESFKDKEHHLRAASVRNDNMKLPETSKSNKRRKKMQCY